MEGLLVYLLAFLVLLIWYEVRRIAGYSEAIHEQILQTRRALGQLPPLSDEPSEEVKALAADPKQRVEAIRRYRQQSGADVKVAMTVVERLRVTRSDAQGRSA